MVGRERSLEVESLLEHVTDWARRRVDVRAFALVGSWAYGAPRNGWLPEVGAVRLVRTLDWGGVTERRFALPGGLEVEPAIGTPAWASVDPLDEGTRRVASDGVRVLRDPDGLLPSLTACLRE